jgi:uncharacterized cysteine cluster protein YcgN (CxxCxxCC family)
MGKDEPVLPFWEQKTLAQMSRAEWESLCDGCGLCCLHKLENDYDLSIHYTDVACRLLDRKSCQCGDYPNRRTLVPDCVELDAANIGDMHWLPRSCAYRLRWEDKPLPAWHYLVCGDRQQVHRSGISRAGRMRSEDDVPEDDWEERIIFRI